MEALITYLSSLQDRVFKILPMKEAFDAGEDNHLLDYIENLIDNCSGAFELYPELQKTKPFLEVRANLAYLKSANVEFKKWRSVILRSTRLIHEAMEAFSSKQS